MIALYWILGISGGIGLIIFLIRIGIGGFIIDMLEAAFEIFTDL